MQWIKRLACQAVAFVLAMPGAGAVDIVVYHNWASPAELAALNVLRDALEASGHHWLALAIPHDVDGDMNVLDLIDADVPPNVFLQQQPGIFRALEARGSVLHLDEQFAASGVLGYAPLVLTSQ